ncbi:MAG TPA: hypothetical protein VKY22_27140 [Bradyrhizobium sp.]|nr:hypothetical protein [Bradyrhizobium sp.]
MAQRLLGWWLFDADQVQIIHATTGQVLRSLGHPNSGHGLTESGNRIWMSFEYRDRDIRVPLLIEWRNIPSAVGGRPLVWRVDYIRSAMLWRADTNSQPAFPPYGVWRRVDDFLTDALACWPAHAQTGAKPGRIAFNGGWLNGSWTSTFYRCVWASTPLRESTDAFQGATLELLTTDPPAPWRPLPPGRPENPPWRAGETDLWSEVQTAISSRSYLGVANGSRLLVALPKALSVRLNLKGLSRLFYADETILTDNIHVGLWDFRRDELPGWSVSFDTECRDAPCGLFDRTKMENIAPLASNSVLPGGKISSARYTPYAVQRRLAQACVDAWLSQSDRSWSCAETPDRPEVISVPAAMASISWTLAGSVMPSKLEALASLEPKLGGKPNPLSFMFDEENDGIERGSSSFFTAGFWRFDPPSRGLVNVLSGQRLVLRERINQVETGNQPAAKGGRIWRFQYEDSECSYPLVVISRLAAQHVLGAGDLTLVWEVDHERSKALWQKESGRQLPPFGLWQRVNECATDALLCWPELEETGPQPNQVISSAGWFNGNWSRAIRRQRDRGLNHCFAEREGPEEPFLQDVNAPAQAWRFVDAPRAVAAASLSQVQQCEPHRLYLPADAALAGFEADIPNLRRADGRAVMFPAGLRSNLHRGEDYDPGAFFLYADEDVFFCVRGSEFAGWRGLRSNWKFELWEPFRIGLRHLDRFDASQPDGVPAAYFWRKKTPRNLIKFLPEASGAIPSPAVTQRVTAALIDGWLAWPGTSKRLLDDPEHLQKLGERARVPPLERSGIDLGQKSQVRVEGAYIGGRFNTRAATTAWIEGDSPDLG